MRFPGDANDQSDRPHFLADGYIKSFNLSIKPFPNYDKNVITCIYGFHEKSEGEEYKTNELLQQLNTLHAWRKKFFKYEVCNKAGQFQEIV